MQPGFANKEETEQVNKLMLDASTIAEEIEVDHVKLMAVTWNLQGGCPTLEILNQLFQKDNVHHDIYVFGT